MSTPHTLEIVIDANGQISSTVHGIAGPDCSKISQWLDELGKVTLDEKTRDYSKPKDQALIRTQK